MLRPLWHLGALHPLEQALTLLLAFGPFLVLGIVVWWRRREDDADTTTDEVAVHEGDSEASDTRSRTAPPSS